MKMNPELGILKGQMMFFSGFSLNILSNKCPIIKL